MKEETGLECDRIEYIDDGSWINYTDPWKTPMLSTTCIAYINGDLEVNQKRV